MPFLPSCTVAEGTAYTVASQYLRCHTITVLGTLQIMSHSFVNASRIVVEAGGRLLVGSATEPAVNVTIYLSHRN